MTTDREREDQILKVAAEIVKRRGIWDITPGEEALGLQMAYRFLERGESRKNGTVPPEWQPPKRKADR